MTPSHPDVLRNLQRAINKHDPPPLRAVPDSHWLQWHLERLRRQRHIAIAVSLIVGVLIGWGTTR